MKKEKDMTNEEWLNHQQYKRDINTEYVGRFATQHDDSIDPEDEIIDDEYTLVKLRQ